MTIRLDMGRMLPKSRITQGYWWNKALTLVEGCTPVHTDCENCHSASHAAVRLFQSDAAIKKKYEELATKNGHWTGTIHLRPDALEELVHARRSYVWYVQNDLFHEDVPDEFIHDCLDTICRASHHIIVISTKRHIRLATVLKAYTDARGMETLPKHVLVGVSVSSKDTSERTSVLPTLPAASKLLIAAPLLGRIDLTDVFELSSKEEPGFHPIGAPDLYGREHVCFVIVSGESGPAARPTPVSAVREILDACESFQVPMFFSGWGEWLPSGQSAPSLGSERRSRILQMPLHKQAPFIHVENRPGNGSRKPIRWVRVWKEHSGQRIDGVEWCEFPTL